MSSGNDNTQPSVSDGLTAAQAASLVHDLNNLLAAIQGYGALLVEDLPEGSSSRMFAANIVEASERAKALVNGRPATRPAETPPPAQLEAPPATGRARVLVIDDEEAVAQLLARMLTRAGFDADWCCDPLDALETFAEDPAGWRVVVSDRSMPGMDGAELAARLRAISPSLAVILCSGHPADPSETLDPAVAAVLAKPVSADQLRRAVQGALDLKR